METDVVVVVVVAVVDRVIRDVDVIFVLIASGDLSLVFDGEVAVGVGVGVVRVEVGW